MCWNQPGRDHRRQRRVDRPHRRDRQRIQRDQVVGLRDQPGYGAAIKEGSAAARLARGFLDADGTCDPRHFAEMCRVAVHGTPTWSLARAWGRTRRCPNSAGSATGSTLSCSGSYAGGRLRHRKRHASPPPQFATTASAASRRPALYAVDERQALANDLRVIEIADEVSRKSGVSKLRVVLRWRRFLQTIFNGVLCYRPERLIAARLQRLCLVVGR